MIDVGSKQAYIFGTNKQILTVGASHLVKQVTQVWAAQAAETLGIDDEHLLLMSGRVIALVPSLDIGRALIRTITSRALREAPGIDVWGVIDSEPAEAGDVASRIGVTYRNLASARAGRRAAAASGQSIPHVARCAFTGAPAIVEPHGRAADPRRRSAAVDASWRAGTSGRRSLADRLGDGGDRAVVSARELTSEGLTGNGWVAVIRADGNGLGQVFSRLHESLPAAKYWSEYRGLSREIESITSEAVVTAVELTQAEADRRSIDRSWLLPLIVGGDDVCMLADARLAWALTTRFARAFEEMAARSQRVSAVLERLAGVPGAAAPSRLTLASGIAYVKPHHPFSHAVALAGQLELSAKSLKHREVSSIDAHVHYDSTQQSLDELRAGSPQCPPVALATAVDGVDHVPFDAINALVGAVVDREVSGTFAHAVRTAAVRGQLSEVLGRVSLRADLTESQRAAFRRFAEQQPGVIIAAMELADVTEAAL